MMVRMMHDNNQEGVSKRYQNDCNKTASSNIPLIRTRRALRSALRDSGSVAMMFERLAARVSITLSSSHAV